jgi:hypothetical protein
MECVEGGAHSGLLCWFFLALLFLLLGSDMLSAATPESTLADGITGVLSFAKKLHVGHDRLPWVVGTPMRDICFVIRNADHQTRRSRGPIDCGARHPGGAIE